jgi:2-amino-4-hydroxy-6-hydroxymethyldihydropteridine diphosphokinase
VIVRARVVLSVGSNLGDRLGTLQGCVQAIGQLPGTDVLAISPVYQTAPVGGPPQPDYLNAVLLVATAQPPRDLLRATQRIEADFGRVRAERFGPRTLDVDIISYADPARDGQLSGGQLSGGLISNDPVLTLPHPRARERAFVLVPWHDLDPAAELPGQGPVAALLDGLDRSGVQPVPGAVLRLPHPAPQPAPNAVPRPAEPAPEPGPPEPSS